VEMTRAQRQVDNIRDCGYNDRSTFFQEPGGDRIRIRLLINTQERDTLLFIWLERRLHFSHVLSAENSLG